MKRVLFPVLVMVGSGVAAPLNHRPPAEVAAKMEVERICFGSCARQNAEQPMWERVVEREPDLFIWLGEEQWMWLEEEKGRKCWFGLTRDGRNLLGGYGRGDGPVLMNWSGWNRK